jgi:hypothetical protein
MTCDVQTLLSSANCFSCAPPGQWGLLRLAMLCRIKNGVTMACDVQTLLSEASCFNCVPPGQWPILELAMLCSIMTTGTGGGGGSGAVMQGHGAPVAPPTTPTSPAIYTDLDSGINYTWRVDTQVWF